MKHLRPRNLNLREDLVMVAILVAALIALYVSFRYTPHG